MHFSTDSFWQQRQELGEFSTTGLERRLYNLLEQQLLFLTLSQRDPYLVLIAFDCGIWSTLTNLNQRINWDVLRKTVGRRTLKLVKRVCKRQALAGRCFLIENPVERSVGFLMAF